MKRLLPLLLCVNVFADVVTLKDGRQITGLVESANAREVRIKVEGNPQVVAADRIQSIQFVAQAAVPPPATTPAPAEPQTITLPIGTEIAVRTIDRINSKKAGAHKEYAASLDDPVVVDGATVVPVNANAFLRVSDVQRAGISRRASLSISLIAVIVNGQRVEVETGKVDSKSGSQAKRTATGAVGGAATGAVIGGLAGGGAGAAVGAIAGGAVGTAGGVIFGKTVEIAPETRFSYRLTQPVEIKYQDADAPKTRRTTPDPLTPAEKPVINYQDSPR